MHVLLGQKKLPYKSYHYHMHVLLGQKKLPYKSKRMCSGSYLLHIRTEGVVRNFFLDKVVLPP
jgi:hypothetical protein